MSMKLTYQALERAGQAYLERLANDDLIVSADPCAVDVDDLERCCADVVDTFFFSTAGTDPFRQFDARAKMIEFFQTYNSLAWNSMIADIENAIWQDHADYCDDGQDCESDDCAYMCADQVSEHIHDMIIDPYLAQDVFDGVTRLTMSMLRDRC